MHYKYSFKNVNDVEPKTQFYIFFSHLVLLIVFGFSPKTGLNMLSYIWGVCIIDSLQNCT